MSQDIGDTRTCVCRSGCRSFLGFSGGAFGGSGGLVVAGGVEDQVAEEFAGGGVDDADLEVLDEQGDRAGFVDAVVADPVVGGGVGGRAGERLGHGVVEGRRGRPVGQRPVGAAVVVLVGEAVEKGLEFGDRGGLGGLGA